MLEKVILENYFRLRDYLPSEKNFPSKDTHKHTHTHLHTHLHKHTHTSGPDLKREEGVLKGGNGHPLIHSKQCPPEAPAWLEQQGVFFFELLRPKKIFEIL